MNEWRRADITDAIYCTVGEGEHGGALHQCFHDGDVSHSEIRQFAIKAATVLAGMADPAAELARLHMVADKAMWVVKNFEEWGDSKSWAGEPFEHLAASVEELAAALEPGTRSKQKEEI
jgi:hypothetical protein